MNRIVWERAALYTLPCRPAIRNSREASRGARPLGVEQQDALHRTKPIRLQSRAVAILTSCRYLRQASKPTYQARASQPKLARDRRVGSATPDTSGGRGATHMATNASTTPSRSTRGERCSVPYLTSISYLRPRASWFSAPSSLPSPPADSLRLPPRLDPHGQTSSPSSRDGILQVTPRHLVVSMLGGGNERKDVGVNEAGAVDVHRGRGGETAVGEEVACDEESASE